MHPISSWLPALGLAQYAAIFTEHEIGLQAVRLLNEKALQELGLPLGPRKLLLTAIAELNAAEASGPAPVTAAIHAAPAAGLSSTAEGERRQLTVMFCDPLS